MFIRCRLSLLLTLALVPAIIRAQQPELIVQTGHTSPVNTISFSPDGKLLASGSGEAFSAVEVNVVKLWDVATGAELRTLTHVEPVAWVAFSADGRRVAAKGPMGFLGSLKVWDVASGNELPGAQLDAGYINRAKSSDGKLAAEIDGKNIKLRDALTGRELRRLSSRTSDFQKVLFSPDSSILATGGARRSVRLWDLRAGVLRTLVGHTDYPVAADFSPDSRLFASGGRDLTVRIWDVASGRELQCLTGHTGKSVSGIKFSPDGRTLFSYDKAGFKLWDVATGRALVSVAGQEVYYEDAHNIAFNPQGNLLAAEAKGGVKLWATATGQELALLNSGGGELHFSPDGKLLATLNFKQLEVWDVADAKRLTVIPTADGGETVPLDAHYYDVRFRRTELSPDARLIAVLEEDSRKITTGRIYLLEAATGKLLHTIADPKLANAEMTFSADGKLLLIFQTEFASSEEEVVLVDVATGQRVRSFKNTKDAPAFRELWTLAPHYFGGDYSFYSANGRFVVWFGNNGELHLAEPQTGRELVTLIGIDENDWLVATDAGFFDGSPVAWQLLTWRFDNNSFQHTPVEAFFNQFYYPGLLADVLAGKRPSPPAGAELARIDRRQPQLAIMQRDTVGAVGRNAAGMVLSGQHMVRLAVEVTDDASAPGQAGQPATGGAHDLRLFRNGSLVRAWHGDLFAPRSGCRQLPARGASAPQRTRCETSVAVVAGANEFTAYAFNHAGVKSTDVAFSLTGANSLKRQGTTYILAVGVNQYANPQYNLKYAVADAAAFSAEVKRQQEGLGRVGRVQAITLFDAQATKQNMLARLAALTAQIQPEDTLIVYFAGHGTAHENRFYLLPHDLGYMGARTAVNQAALDAILAHGISDRELEAAFEKIDAAQLVFVIDACNSGQALEAEEKRRGPMNSKGLAQLAYEKGMYILTAAQSFQAAQEAAQVGHGLLTYALVEEGLKQAVADDEPKDGQIVVREWLDYATARVPRMQLDQMQAARGLGLDLSFTEAERGLEVEHRTAQRPRVFYRREPEAQPPIIAKPAAHH